MIIILLFGLGMSIFGLYMSIKPNHFSRGIIKFSEKPWFHIFEIVTRLVLGLLFVFFSEQTKYPNLVMLLGIVFCLVSVLLVIIGSTKHRQFAVFVANYLKNKFRYIGGFATILGLLIMYVAMK